MRAGIKSGLIFGVIFIITTLPSLGLRFLPDNTFLALLSSLNCCLYLIIYPGSGVVASYLLSPPRNPSSSAVEGAIAGGIATAVQGSFALLTSIIFIAAGIEISIPPESQAILEETGLQFLFTPAGQILSICFSLAFSLVISATMAAIGGALHAAVQKD